MIKVANAPCSWGVIENIEGERFEYAQVLDEIQATGYAGTELGDWGFMPTEPVALKKELQTRGLAMLASWVSAKLIDSNAHLAGETTAVQVARLLAAVADDPMIVLGDDHSTVEVRHKNAGRIQPEHGMSQEQWQVFAAGVNRIAQAVRDQTGLRTVFHPHCASWVETPQEVERILQLTDPDLVGLCFDTGHYRFGGGHPVSGLKEYAGRIWHVHFKDCEPNVAARSRREGWTYTESVGHGVFCELGRGDVDFPGVLSELKAIGYEGWIVVEQDVLPGMGSPKESARRNRQYLQSIGL